MTNELPVVAWENLLALRAVQPEGEPDIVAELVETFASESARLIEDARRGVDTANLDLVRRATHRLFGSAAAIGAERLRHAAELLEVQLRQSDPGDFRPAFATMEGALAEVQQELRHVPPVNSGL